MPPASRPGPEEAPQPRTEEDLSESWLTLGHRSDGADIPQAARALMNQLQPGELAFGARGQVWFKISPEGRIAVHPDIPLDDIAEEFLVHLATKRAGMTARLQQLGALEMQLIRLGQADFRHEAAQRAAGSEEPPPNAAVQVEVTRAALEMEVHQLIELGRTLAERAIPQGEPAIRIVSEEPPHGV